MRPIAPWSSTPHAAARILAEALLALWLRESLDRAREELGHGA
jgi:hypothetical protein